MNFKFKYKIIYEDNYDSIIRNCFKWKRIETFYNRKMVLKMEVNILK